MRVFRFALGMVVVAGVLGAAAFAAGLGVSSRTLAGGSTVVAPCDPHDDAWTYGPYTLNGNGQVMSLTVGNIAPTCAGGSLAVSVSDTTGSHNSTSAPVAIAGGARSCGAVCSQVVTLATPEYPSDIAKVYAVVTGP